MLGYIAPDKGDLKVCELASYNAYYCGLCKSIGKRYGQGARLTLSYDCSFCAMLLAGIEGESGCAPCRCSYKPFAQKRPMAHNNAQLSFAADLEICLAWYKLKDDWADEKRALALIGKTALYAPIRRAKKLAPRLAGTIEDGIRALSKLERENCAEIDAPADAFATMMKNAMALAPIKDERNKTVLMGLMYELGRWLYLMDAWDDRKKDKKSGAYNPFVAALAEDDASRAGFLLNISLNKAIAAYDLLDLKAHRGVIDNIMYRGCVMKTQSLHGGES